MKQFVVLLVLGPVFGLSSATQADELDLKATGRKDKDFLTVLRYSGDGIGKALAGGNKSKDTKKLNELIKVDKKDPRYGVLKWQCFELRQGDKAVQSRFPKPVELRLHRKDKKATDWELTKDAIKVVQNRVALALGE
jgi:hypothetical protein